MTAGAGFLSSCAVRLSIRSRPCSVRRYTISGSEAAASASARMQLYASAMVSAVVALTRSPLGVAVNITGGTVAALSALSSVFWRVNQPIAT